MNVAEPDFDLVGNLLASTVGMPKAKLAEEFSSGFAKKGATRNFTPTVYIIGAHPLFRRLQEAFQLENQNDAVIAVIDVPEQSYMTLLRPGKLDVTYKRETFWKRIGGVLEVEPHFIARAFRGTKEQVTEIARAMCSPDPKAVPLRKLARRHNRPVAGNEAPAVFDPFEL
jgi:hypothetical protein